MKAKTVTASILVAIDETGNWAARGWADGSRDDYIGAFDGVEGLGRRFHWIEVELPIPHVIEPKIIGSRIAEYTASQTTDAQEEK
jgi:hypothetical protein